MKKHDETMNKPKKLGRKRKAVEDPDYDVSLDKEQQNPEKSTALGKRRKVGLNDETPQKEYDDAVDKEKKQPLEEDMDLLSDDMEDSDDEEMEENKENETNETPITNESKATSSLFHSKTRIVEAITPEAMIETLRFCGGNLLIKSDELKVLIKMLFLVDKTSI